MNPGPFYRARPHFVRRSSSTGETRKEPELPQDLPPAGAELARSHELSVPAGTPPSRDSVTAANQAWLLQVAHAPLVAIDAYLIRPDTEFGVTYLVGAPDDAPR